MLYPPPITGINLQLHQYATIFPRPKVSQQKCQANITDKTKIQKSKFTTVFVKQHLNYGTLITKNCSVTETVNQILCYPTIFGNNNNTNNNNKT